MNINKKIKKIAFITLGFLAFSYPSLAETNHIIQAQYIMGTVYTIEAYDSDKDKAQKSISLAFGEIRKCDKILSNYRKDSELNQVLEEAGSHPVKVSDYLFEITQRSLYFSKLTNGLFDITIEPLVELWGFKNKVFKKPNDKQIKKVKENVGYKNIILDNENKTIFLKNSKLRIDFGGIGKGFAVGKALNILKQNGIKSALINSVSDQYYLGSPPNQTYWKIGIKSARKKDQVVKYFNIKNKTVSTSGDYEQFFIEKGIRYSHIINPITGYPTDKKIVASTIISDNPTDADALTTVILLMDNSMANKLIKLFPNTKLYLIEK